MQRAHDREKRRLNEEAFEVAGKAAQALREAEKKRQQEEEEKRRRATQAAREEEEKPVAEGSRRLKRDAANKENTVPTGLPFKKRFLLG